MAGGRNARPHLRFSICDLIGMILNRNEWKEHIFRWCIASGVGAFGGLLLSLTKLHATSYGFGKLMLFGGTAAFLSILAIESINTKNPSIYGPKPYARTGSINPNAMAIEGDCACQRQKRNVRHPYRDVSCPYNSRCLREIPFETILHKIEALLQSPDNQATPVG